MLESHLPFFVLLYSSRLLIVLYSPNGVRVQTNTHGIQILRENNIPSGTSEYKRNTNEYKRVTKTQGERHPRRYKRVQAEYKRAQTRGKHMPFSNLALAKEDGGGRMRRRRRRRRRRRMGIEEDEED